MPYILNKTDGTQITIVQDASLDLTTDLIFVGRNYAGYGEWQNENFLKLLENFSNTIPPSKPIDGQLWYDTANKRLNVFDGANWKSISNLDVNTENPNNTKIYESGDLWFDSREEQLYAYNGENFVLIGPPSGADTRAQWKGDVEYAQEDTGTPKYGCSGFASPFWFGQMLRRILWLPPFSPRFSGQNGHSSGCASP